MDDLTNKKGNIEETDINDNVVKTNYPHHFHCHQNKREPSHR
jgi:hypothetical protein